ncbi:helix-turn-helix domain-containing protein [Coleofasciculus sp. FACHB-1120]|uniref:helix-turn-helix domain-containing protein n=1 Tax=Coleofasciculus sp. FACHB-1120 TaxID=2692783 RepID=UPI0016855406|nr:helix-turn-helix domain-containing protein [Coleofasciculus sp. FACHB-1120]MBD2740974.1 helix-turn-helix domain-containing protein [Coleofasciculus sp. FACHB-1120]
MRIAHQYRLRPTQQQLVRMKEWIGALRWQYNYRLAERFNWWEQKDCNTNCYCQSSCLIASIKDKPDSCSQKRKFKKTNPLFPSDKRLFFEILQNCIEQLAIPRYNRKAQKRIERLQRQLSRQKQGSKCRVKAVQQIKLSPLNVANQRQNFYQQVANWLLKQLMVVADWDLINKKLAGSKLAKFVTSARWQQSLSVLALIGAGKKRYLAFKCLIAGRHFYGLMHPSDTIPENSICEAEFSKTQVDRWLSYSDGRLALNRDENVLRKMKEKVAVIPLGCRIKVDRKTLAKTRTLQISRKVDWENRSLKIGFTAGRPIGHLLCEQINRASALRSQFLFKEI